MKENSLKAFAIKTLKEDTGVCRAVNLTSLYGFDRAHFERSLYIYDTYPRDKWVLRIAKTKIFHIGLQYQMEADTKHISLTKFDQSKTQISARFKRFLVHL